MAAVLLQSAQKVVTGVNGTTLAFGSDVTVGSLLRVTHVHYISGGASVNTPTDTLGHSYTPITAELVGGTTERLCGFYVVNATAGANTVTFDADGVDTGAFTVVIDEYSGVSPTAALDQTSVGGPTTGTAVDSGATPTTIQADELIVGAMTHNGADNTITETGSATLVQEHEGGTADMPIATSYRVVSSTGAYAATWTLPVSAEWLAYVGTFRAGTVELAEPAPVYPYKIPQAVG